MTRIFACAVVFLALAGSLPVPSHAWADEDDSGRMVSCSPDVSPARLLRAAPGNASTPVTVAPDRVPGMSLAAPDGDGWGVPIVNESRVLVQQKKSAEGSVAQLVVMALASKDQAVLRAMLEADRRRAQGGLSEPGGSPEILADVADDARGHPSWTVRERATWVAEGTLCYAEENVEREMLFANNGESYLVTVRGFYIWHNGPGRLEPDFDVSDEVYERALDMVTATANG